MAKSPKLEPFVFAPDDPLALEHAAVSEWIEEAVASLDEHQYYQDVDLKSLPSGKRLLDAKPEQARRYVLAQARERRLEPAIPLDLGKSGSKFKT